MGVQYDLRLESLTGLWVALVIVFLWLSSLEFLLLIDISQLAPLGILSAIAGRTFIHTGLFIIAHDAIHGSVFVGSHRLNHLIGQLALTLYALLPYQKLSFNHLNHHQYPGQAGDPDFHDGIHCNMVVWYLKFMKGYLDVRQRMVLLFGMGIIFLVLYLGFHIPVANLLLFWVLPIAFSSMQLFLFGTYLPHRMDKGESGIAESSHPVKSSHYPLILSFLTCYHFGYHWEHHAYPFLPWYKLPSVHQVTKMV
jgi:beta-carotene/zeaxanthin 4-ketolase